MKSADKSRKSGPQSKDLVKKILEEFSRFKNKDPKILQGRSEQEHLNASRKENTTIKFKTNNYYSVGEYCDRYSISISEAINKIIDTFFSTQKSTIQHSPITDMESAIENITKAFSRLKNERHENDIGDTNK